MRSLVLASSSVYRRALLARLQLPFSSQSPDLDERPRAGETPQALAARLSLSKAHALQASHPDSLIIGSDQVAGLADQLLGKPGCAERAAEQLRQSAGQRVSFYTGLCLLDARHNRFELDVIRFDVSFLPLTEAQILSYIRKEHPLDCAGSFKCEGLGISLFAGLHGDDPTALEGLPLIRLCAMLRAAGLDPLQP